MMSAMTDKPLRDLLKTYFGYESFLPLQEEIIANVLALRDSLVLMPTGAGKSLCYQLPALCLEGLTLVVSPLIALMKDQVDALKANGVAAELINSTLLPGEVTQVRALAQSGRLKVLYLAPERLALFGFREWLNGLKVSLIAIDEAHCISEWGHDFRPDYRNLKVLRQDFPSVPVIALTATATDRVREDIVEQLDLGEAGQFRSSFNRPNLTYRVQPKAAAFDSLVSLLRAHRGEPAIVYCFSRKDTEGLAADLSANGLRALPYHAGLDGSVRKTTQERFIRDEAPIIVATIAFGMGIDKPDIRLVVHYDLPKSMEGYYQETGRAGRDGLPSECVLFYSYGDKIKHDYFIDQIEDEAERENAQGKLEQMLRFCQVRTCRRQYVLKYFGEAWDRDNCGACDACLTEVEEFDATEITQKVLSGVVRTGQRFGAAHVTQVLRGANTARIRSFGHDALSVHGIVEDMSDGEVRQVIELLLEKGLLARGDGDYPTLAVPPAGMTFLNRRDTLTLTRPKSSVEGTPDADAWEMKYDRALFGQLRDLRRDIAERSRVPAYVVFGDATLRQMAYYLPQSMESMGRMSGVGTAKLAQYGQEFLEVVQTHAADKGRPERDVPPSRKRADRSSRRPGPTYQETLGLLQQGLSIGEIAQRRGLAWNTVAQHLERLREAGETLDLDHLMPPPERVDKINEAFKATGGRQLTPAKELLGDDYSYEELRVVRLHLAQTGELEAQTAS